MPHTKTQDHWPFGSEDDILFVSVDALRPSQQFLSHVETFSLVELVQSNEDKVSC